jgi:hypothetical protein
MKRDAAVYLDDIIESIRKIEEYTKGLDLEGFTKDFKTQDAVIRNFEIIGEAARSIPSEIKKKYPLVPWKSMIGMRNKMIHEYSGIMLEVVWKAVKEDIPPLEKHLKEIRAKQKILKLL